MYEFYGRFAEWWPLISPVSDYREEAALYGELLGQPGTLLELGSGGGNNAHWIMEAGFKPTLVDLSEDMLAVSRRLNPEARHLAGDMRSVRLSEQFDAVLIHDAIDYMTTEADLEQAIATAALHCRPGGRVLLTPDDTREQFHESCDHEGVDGEDGRSVRYLEWTWDPDPTDTWVRTEYSFVFRHPDGRIETAHEAHITGLFPKPTWVELMTRHGLDVTLIPQPGYGVHPPRTFFLGTRR